ncbi:MAG: hypothetical protein WCG27_13500, partial [Pseudomonadota bacterium]
PRDREIIKLSNEYHFDISYESSALYSQPRDLRAEGWRGWNMWDPLLLYQKGRFFEYTQSIVRAQFDDPINVIKRSRFFAEPARQAWFQLQLNPDLATPTKVLSIASDSANAVACLSGPPLTERSLLTVFLERTKNISVEELVKPLFSGISRNVSPETIQLWLPEWESAFSTASLSPSDLRIHPSRLTYYKNSILSQLNSDFPASSLWPLLNTWSLAVENGNLAKDQIDKWLSVCSELGLSTTSFQERLQSIDVFLDLLEEVLYQLETDNGLKS